MSASGILVIVSVFFMVAGAFFGMIRGFGRSFLRLLTVLFAFLGSAYICKRLVLNGAELLSSEFAIKLLDRLGITVLESAGELLPNAYDMVLSLLLALAAPLLFLVCFLLLSAVLLPIYGIAAAFVFPKLRGVWSPISNLFGAFVGIAQGALIILAVMVPVVGFVGLSGDAIDTVGAEQGSYESPVVAKAKTYRDDLHEMEQSFVFAYAKRFGAQGISDSLMRFSFTDKSGKHMKIDAGDELLVLSGMYAHAMPLIGRDVESYGEIQADALRLLADDFADSKLMTQLVADMLSQACTAWRGGKPYATVKPIKAGGDVADLLDVFYSCFADSTAKTVSEDVAVIADTLEVLTEHRILSSLHDENALRQKLSSPVLIDELMAVLNENPRTKALSDALLSLAVKAFCSQHIPLPDADSEYYGAYRDMLGTVADALNGLDCELELAQQLESIRTELHGALVEYGVSEENISSEVVDTVSDMLMDQFGEDLGSVTPEDIEAFIGGQMLSVSDR